MGVLCQVRIVVQSGDRLIYTSPWQRLGKPAQRPEDGYYGIDSFLLLFFFFFCPLLALA